MSVLKVKHTPEFGPAYVGRPNLAVSPDRPADINKWKFMTADPPAKGDWVQVWWIEGTTKMHAVGLFLGYKRISGVWTYEIQNKRGNVVVISEATFPAFSKLSKEDAALSAKALQAEKDREAYELAARMAEAEAAARLEAQRAKERAFRQDKAQLDERLDQETMKRMVSAYESFFQLNHHQAQIYAEDRMKHGEYRGASMALNEVLALFDVDERSTLPYNDLVTWMNATKSAVKKMRDDYVQLENDGQPEA